MGRLTFYGACGTVTGSLYLMEAAGKKILVDCGLYQGVEAVGQERSLPFDPQEIDYVFLTHAHLDHSGRLLELVRGGFRGEILTLQATVELLEIVLRDRLHLDPQAGTEGDLSRLLELCWPFAYHETVEISPYLSFRFQDAGHILGSAHLELWAEGQKFVFSGDIGRWASPIIKDPTPITEADYVVVESTYGGKSHPSWSTAKKQLQQLLRWARSKKVRLFMPSFAIGRTQEILYFLNELVESGKVKPFPVILDSPMALRVTKIYAKHTELYDEEALKRLASGDEIFSFPLLFSTPSVAASRHIDRLQPPYLVIAGSGMVTGGRIVEHLKHHLGDPHTWIVFVGYQGEGTPGRAILERRPVIKLDNHWVANKAKVFRLEAFSAHADHQELIRWLSALKGVKKLFITHGEEPSRVALQREVKLRFGWPSERPQLGRIFAF